MDYRLPTNADCITKNRLESSTAVSFHPFLSSFKPKLYIAQRNYNLIWFQCRPLILLLFRVSILCCLITSGLTTYDKQSDSFSNRRVAINPQRYISQVTKIMVRDQRLASENDAVVQGVCSRSIFGEARSKQA